MVVFTCNHCGDSLKKAAVDKHYMGKCRGGPIFISCMDCSKDFRDDYVDHIKCISEMEKYSDKNYVPRPGQNKGERKQEAWTTMVRNVIAAKSATIDPNIRGIMNKLANCDNVPRKQVKFKNFLKNSFRLYNGQDEIIWKLLEEQIAKENQNQQNGNANSSNKLEKSSVPASNGTTTVSNGGDLSCDSPSKKRKHIENNVEKADSTSAVNGKQKKQKLTTTENGASDDVQPETTKFSWEETILKVLNKKNQMKEDKLRQKVLKKYLKFSEKSELTEKMTKKFNKKLKSIDSICYDNDLVTLKNV